MLLLLLLLNSHLDILHLLRQFREGIIHLSSIL